MLPIIKNWKSTPIINQAIMVHIQANMFVCEKSFIKEKLANIYRKVIAMGNFVNQYKKFKMELKGQLQCYFYVS